MFEKLKHLGLSENEAKVYMAMLELGPSVVVEIARKSQINRPTTYVQIESLKGKGLVSAQIKGKKQYFSAESPDKLELLIDNELKTVEDKKSELNNYLPDLLNLFNTSGQRPHVKFFEGKEGVLALLKEFLKTDDTPICGITSLDNIFEVFPEFENTYIKKRVQKKIPSRTIYTSKKGAILKESDKLSLRESKYVEPGKLPLGIDITILKDKVAVIALKGKISGTLIEHREVADSFRAIFELVWNKID
jgi:sugar-specific transcriptional regulator TrmB